MSTDSLRDHILGGRFDAALPLTRNLSLDDLRDALVGLAFETENIAVYGFCVALIASDAAKGHGLASDVMATSPLNHLPGAYATALYHARQASALAPDDLGYREFLLFFDGQPDKLMSHDEAVVIAKDLLARDPGNAAAKAVLGH